MDLSRCKFCGSRKDVFYMLGDSICYDCAIDKIKVQKGVKVEKENGIDVVYRIGFWYLEEGEYEKCYGFRDIVYAMQKNSLESTKDRDYIQGEILRDTTPKCGHVKCELWEDSVFRNLKHNCNPMSYNLFLIEDEETGEILTVCDNYIYEKIGLKRILKRVRNEYYYIYFYKSNIIGAIKLTPYLWEKDLQIEKILNYCVENLGLKLELIEDVEYTDNYFVALGENARTHMYYKVIDYKKLDAEKHYHRKSSKRKMNEEISRFIEKEFFK